MERGPLPTEQQRDFDLWLAASTRHEGAFHRARAVGMHLDKLGALACGRRGPDPVPYIVTRRGALTAAVLSTVGLLSAATWFGGVWDPNSRVDRYTTGTGEMRRIGLIDGYEMVLNTATEVLVTYAGHRRALRLSRGEAFFTVARHVSRPFLVCVGQLMLRAIGSAFAVRRIDADIAHITVTEGMLELLRADGAGRDPQRLYANHEATVGTQGLLETRVVPSAELQRRFSWLSGVIIFNGQPLYEAIREMNRYSHFRLLIEDADLAQRHIVGVFRVADIGTFLSTLQQSFDVETVFTGNTVLLRQRPNAR